MHNVSVRKRTLEGRPVEAGAVDCKRFTVGEAARGTRPGPQRKIRDARTYRPDQVAASSNRPFGRYHRYDSPLHVRWLLRVAHAVILAGLDSRPFGLILPMAARSSIAAR